MSTPTAAKSHRFVAYALTKGAYATDQSLTVVEEEMDGTIVRDLLSVPLPPSATADSLLTSHGWTPLDTWAPIGAEEGAWVTVGRAGPGQPRTVARRIPIGFPPDLLAELERLKTTGAISSISAEVVRRCRAAGPPPT